MLDLNSFLYPPAGDCILLHDRLTLALNMIGNLGTALAYMLIPAALIAFTLAVLPQLDREVWELLNRKYAGLGIVATHGKLLPYEFALFVLCCGATHAYTDYSYHTHTYFQLGILECFTAFVSLVVAVHLLVLAFLCWRYRGRTLDD